MTLHTVQKILVAIIVSSFWGIAVIAYVRGFPRTAVASLLLAFANALLLL